MSVHGVPSAVLCNDALGQVIVGGEVSFVASESAKTYVATSAVKCRAESSLYKSAVDKASKFATQCDSASGLNGGTGLAVLTICTSAATSRQLPVFPLVGLLFASTFAMPNTQNGLLLLPWMAPSGL